MAVEFDAGSARPADGFDPASAQAAPEDAPPKKPTAKPNLISGADAAGAGIGETALHVGTAAAAMPVQAAVSLYELMVSPPGTKAHAASLASQKAGAALTYQPRTATGQGMSKAVDYAGGKVSEFGNWLADKTEEKTHNEGLAATAAMLPQAAAVALGTKLPGSVGKAVGTSAKALERARIVNAPMDASAQAAFQAGFKISAGETGGKLSQTARALSGPAQHDKEISVHNVGRVQEVAKVDIGLHPSEVLDQSAIDAKRAEAFMPYEAMRRTGTVTADHQYLVEVSNAGSQFAKLAQEFPDPSKPAVGWTEIEREKGKYSQPTFTADGAVSAMKQLRKDSRTNLKVYDPEKNSLGLVQRQIADAFQNQLDRHAAKIGQPQLGAALNQARTKLAKIQDLEDSMVGDTVDAQRLARLWDSGRGRPMTGGLKTVAEAATNFKKSFQSGVKPDQWSGYMSAVDMFIGVVGGAHALPLAALAGARPVTRAVLRSKFAQKRITSTPSYKQGVVKRAIKSVADKKTTAAASAAATAAEDEQQ